jgi:hypothetical protein
MPMCRVNRVTKIEGASNHGRPPLSPEYFSAVRFTSMDAACKILAPGSYLACVWSASTVRPAGMAATWVSVYDYSWFCFYSLPHSHWWVRAAHGSQLRRHVVKCTRSTWCYELWPKWNDDMSGLQVSSRVCHCCIMQLRAFVGLSAMIQCPSLELELYQ